MSNEFIRTELLIGKDGLNTLKNARVAVFGLGGVGGYAVEALARGGIGALDIIDCDIISESNINRQIYALKSTIGMAKTDVSARRIADIDPSIKVRVFNMFYLPETADSIDFTDYDYIVDAIDTVTAKLEIVKRATAAGVPVICSMGTGNKLNPAMFEVADIYKTSVCPLAKVMRKLCRDNGIKHLKVVYSKEQPMKVEALEQTDSGAVLQKRHAPGSISFVPPVAGFIIAGEVIKDILKKKGQNI